MKPNKIKKILIALDYIPSAVKVAEAGFLLARSIDAEVILLHVISDAPDASSGKHIIIIGFASGKEIEPLKSENADDLKKASQMHLDKTKSYLGDKSIITLVEEGDIAGSILKAANELGADIIVMGSESRKRNKNFTMGSIIENVFQLTPVPLYIIPLKKYNLNVKH